MTQRRKVIACGGLWLATLPGWAQSARKVHRIGMLGVGSTSAEMAGPQPMNPSSASLLDGLRDLGYVYGEDVFTEPRSPAGQLARFPALVAELIELRVDVIVAAGPSLAALKQATSTLPIVMAGAEDPVGLGVVKTLAHPGTCARRPRCGAHRACSSTRSAAVGPRCRTSSSRSCTRSACRVSHWTRCAIAGRR